MQKGSHVCSSRGLMNMQIFQLIKRESSPQISLSKISKLQVLWGKTMLKSASGKNEGWCLGRFPFLCVNFSCPSAGAPTWNVLRYIKMLFFPPVNWLGSGLTCTPLGEFCKMFIVITTQLSPVLGVQAMLIQPQFHVNVSYIWLLGCWVNVLSLKYISHEKREKGFWFIKVFEKVVFIFLRLLPIKKNHPVSAQLEAFEPYW